MRIYIQMVDMDGLYYFLHFIVVFLNFSLASTWGIIQEGWNKEFNGNFSQLSLSWVGSILISFAYASGPLNKTLRSFLGLKSLLMLGNILEFIGLMCASFSQEYWQLILTSGVISGIGISLIYMNIVGIPSQWFYKKRGLSNGIMMSSIGVGGLVFSPVVQLLIEKYNVRWCYRILSIIFIIGNTLAIFLIKNNKKITSITMTKNLFDLSFFKNKKFLIFIIGNFLCVMIYMVPFVYLTRYSEKINISSYSSSIIISIMNGLNAIGRISMGYMGDKYGHINILVISIFLSSLSILLIWLFSTTYILILIFGIIYGFISGSYWSLLVPICGKLTDVSNLINGINIIYFVNFIGYLVGIPIAELIFGLQTNTLNTFLILYCGILMLSASFCYLLLKIFSNKKLFIKV